jgi:hypothetical protein
VLVLVKLIPQLGSLEHLTLGSYMEGTETLSALLEVRCVAHGSLHRPMSAAAVHTSSRAGARANMVQSLRNLEHLKYLALPSNGLGKCRLNGKVRRRWPQTDELLRQVTMER